MLTQQLRILATCLFHPDDIVEVRHLLIGNVPGASSQFFKASRLHRGMESIEHYNLGANSYFGCNPRRQRGGMKSEDVALARCLCAEWDETTWVQAWQRIRSAGMPNPTLVLWSGGGPHAYWRLTDPVTDMDYWSECQRSLIRVLGSDASIHDAPRIMRLPGTFNHRRGVSARILWADASLRYSLDEVLYRIPLKVKQAKEKPAVVRRRGGAGNIEERARKYLEKCSPAISGQRGHSVAFAVVRSLVWGFEITNEEQALALLSGWNARCDPAWSERELRHKIRESLEKPYKKRRGWLRAG